MSAPTPLILDVDTGVDDALAIGLAVSRPDIDLLAVSTLAGNIDVANATENSSSRAGPGRRRGGARSHVGASRPLARPHRNAAHYHGVNGIGDAVLPESNAPLGPDRRSGGDHSPRPSASWRNHAGGGGADDQLAIALNVCPDLPTYLKRFVIMGGVYRNPGNITPFAEFNIWADPEAAQQVFAANFPGAIAVGLDVSHQTSLGKEFWELATRTPAALPTLLAEVCRRSFVARGQAGFHLHDPLATAVAVDASLVTTERGELTWF